MQLTVWCRSLGCKILLFAFCTGIVACTPEGVFIEQVDGREEGFLCFTEEDKGNRFVSRTKCYDHLMEPPYLLMDWHHDELWSPWPEIQSLSGFAYSYSEYSDRVMGYAIQDLCEDSIRLVYHSVFGDTVSLINRVYPNSVLKPDYAVLDKLAGYKKVDDLASLGVDQDYNLEIYLFETGRGHRTNELYEMMVAPNNRSIVAFAEYDFQRDSTYYLSPEEVRNFTRAIEEGVYSCSNCGSTTYSSVYLKRGGRLLNLTNEKNNVGKLLIILNTYKPVFLPDPGL